MQHRRAGHSPRPLTTCELDSSARIGATAGVLKDYPGSKGGAGVWQRIISEMPPHETYIEPFLGSGVVMRKKLRSSIAIGVDASSRVIDAWHRSVRADNGAAVLNAVCGDALSLTPFLVQTFPSPALVYADPPYLLETRSCKRRYYEHEILTADDHRKVLAMLKALPCMVIVSGYWSELYAAELSDWRTVQIPTVNRRGARVIEWLWCNYPEPVELHDYRFVGSNFRERWGLEKMRRRWKAKLEKMSAVQRRALLWAASQVSAPGTALPPATPIVAMKDGSPRRKRRWRPSTPKMALTAAMARLSSDLATKNAPGCDMGRFDECP